MNMTITTVVRRTMLAAVASLLSMNICGQQVRKIDFNNNQNKTEEGYEGWYIDGVQSAEKTLDGVTLTIAEESGTVGRTLKGNWYKNGINQNYWLVCDGVTVWADGNITSGAVGMKVTISGLSTGSHSLLAYFNNTDQLVGPPVAVYVGEGAQDPVQTVEPTKCPETLTASASGQSYITFDATEGQDVVIIYRTVPDPNATYTTTSFFINALVLDRPNPKMTALDPSPSNGDMHADCDGGSATLSWTAAESAVRYHVWLGTSENSMAEVATVNTNAYAATGLDTKNTYYWRVDAEDAIGQTSTGDVWSFRPRRLAFPGAEGYGRYAIGGRGGTVYHVTSLADDGSEGTFRYGITNVSGPRTIVFDVGGVIYLNSRLTCSDPYVTIAGQTAPGQGILLRGAPFGMASDGITRFLRLHRGHILSDADANKGIDGMGMAGNDHAIMDHCSIAWTIDEGFSSRNAKNITLQRTLISEALNVAGHPNYPAGTGHGYAATIGGGQSGALGSSFHHNLLAHNEGRNWSLSGGLDGSGNYDGHHDVFNNVCYNWETRATDGGTHELNFVNNYYKKGASTTQDFLLRLQIEKVGTGTQRAYVSGNIREETNGSQTVDAKDVTYRCETEKDIDWEPFVNTPFFPSYATVETADQAFKTVLSDVGCNQPALSNHDQRMISETLNGTTTTTGRNSGKAGLIDHEDDSEGFSGLNIGNTTRIDDWDNDNDGIPNWFELAMGTSTNSANNNDDTDGDGYTDLEEYLNWMAEPHFFTDADGNCSIDLKPYFMGFGDSFSASASGGATVSGQTLTISGLGSNALKTISVTVSGMTRQFNFCHSSLFTDESQTANGNQTGLTIPTTSSSYIDWSNAEHSGNGDTSGTTIGNTKKNSVYTFTLSNYSAQDYVLTFAVGSKNPAKWLVTITNTVNSEEIFNKNVDIPNTGNYTPSITHNYLISQLPTGTYELTFAANDDSNTGYFGNLGNLAIYTAGDYDAIPGTLTLSKGMYSSDKMLGGDNIGNIKKGATASYTFINNTAGVYQMAMDIKRYGTGGTMNIKIVDSETNDTEVDYNYTIASDAPTAFTANSILLPGKLTTGIKTMTLTFSSEGNEYICNYKAPTFTKVYDEVPVITGETGWATGCLTYDAAVPAGAKAYYISAATASTLTLTEVAFIPAGEGFIFNAAQGNYEFEHAESVSPISGNLLVGTTTATTVEASSVYVLAKIDSETVGMKLYSGTSIAAGKAYLPKSNLPKVAGTRALNFDFGDGTTAIKSIDDLQIDDQRSADASWYDLSGRRLATKSTAKGLYIVNGKKVVIR